MTEQFVVVGSPISHSKSPLIHNACFAFLSRDASYVAQDVIDLSGFLAENSQLRGLSVTMPLKEQAYQLAQHHDEASRRTRSCNTLIRRQTGWMGYNTDVFGLRQASRSIAATTVSVLGTGASARSALVAFEDCKIAIWGRNQSKSLELAAEFGGISVGLEEALNAELVVSTLPGAVLRELMPTGSTFAGKLFDISYVNSDSPSPQFPNGQIPGLEMLIWQAVMQQRVFAGNDPQHPLEDETKLLEVIRVALNVAK